MPDLAPRPHLTIRPPTYEDAEALARLGARTFTDTYAQNIDTDVMTEYVATAFAPDRIATELADPRSVFLVAEADGSLVGYTKIHRGRTPPCVNLPDAIELERLYVERSWFGAGVGQTLLRIVLKEAERLGHRAIWLGVNESNFRARAFYGKWRFVEVGAHEFILGSEAQQDIVMVRRLRGSG